MSLLSGMPQGRVVIVQPGRLLTFKRSMIREVSNLDGNSISIRTGGTKNDEFYVQIQYGTGDAERIYRSIVEEDIDVIWTFVPPGIGPTLALAHREGGWTRTPDERWGA